MEEGLARLNGLPPGEARERLRACCAATDWVETIVAARPFPDREALLRAAETALRTLDWTGVRQAVDAHPRIGERVAAAASREAAWSAAEQSGMDTASDETRTALVEANRAYEERFGHVLLVFATGRSDEELLAAARERVGNPVAEERAIVLVELEKIVLLRLTKLLDAP